MPTPDQLSVAGELRVWPRKLALGKPVVRNIYIGNRAGSWIHENLKSLPSDGFFDGVESPREQLADVFRRMMTGENINLFPPKTLRGHPDWLHEVRTADLRIFGWFWRRSSFIVSMIAPKSKFSNREITYSGCLETCRADRDQLDLDPPKFIEGDINDIL